MKNILKILLIICIFSIVTSLIIFFCTRNNNFSWIKNKRNALSCSDLKQQILRNNNIFSETVNGIPKNIIQTYSSLDLVPTKVLNNISKYAPDYNCLFFDDKQCVEFLKKYFSDEVVNTYNRLEMKAHKADLFRYCSVYILGGIYLDIKTELLVDISTLIKPGINLHFVLCDALVEKNTIYNGIIFANQYNDIFLKLIYFIMNLPRNFPYHTIVRDLYQVLVDETKQSKLKLGLNNFCYLFSEKHTDKRECKEGLDRYGLCTFVYDFDKPIIKTRYHDFPWK